MLIVKVIIEGLGLGLILCLLCAFGIQDGAVGMIHLYSQEVQQRAAELGLVTAEEIRKRGAMFKAVCVPVYMIYVVVCVYLLNGARGFLNAFWQMFAILSIMNLIDRFLVDGWWVGHTTAWDIPGTEDLKPYISAADKKKKWLSGTVGMAMMAALLSGIMSVILH